ncbi:hypothetical protein [Rhizobium sp. NZLR1]|uniref:hypothetical protein n=1 Tax=Rhizobium sp. NZLR1 TaxID=2731096 RepID=UPI001A999C90|nr:hypothetical protein [Rhizobium sp. NZLR1]MBX5202235.1 hypothetical protein [Rhizobium sp. NZLR1]QSZ20851.1 hypothetical protein J3O30_21590 [Rhizobium sp. NZLR1]
MSISIDRLRRLAEDRTSAHVAMRRAWDDVLAARKPLSDAKIALDSHIEKGGRRRDLNSDKPFEAAVKMAQERLAVAEAAHSRLQEAWNLNCSLARRGYEYARDHTNIPADIEESFQ